MNKLILVLATPLLTLVLCPTWVGAQLIEPAKRVGQVKITNGPELESTHDTWAIISWTSNNPGGTDDHFGVVRFGKTANDLQQTAKSHIRLNQGHPVTVFRVRVLGLQPHTTYYYKVDSESATGASDGVTSPLKTFTTQ